MRGAKAHADDDAAEAWNNVLLQGTPDAAGSDDLDATTKARHDALLKELSGRAEKGDATAQQFAETLSLSLIHISEPTRRTERSRMPSSA